ncbi:MAG: hypothetical protein ACKPKO_18105, partial [Candidatus Fonsibacter sp.]
MMRSSEKPRPSIATSDDVVYWITIVQSARVHHRLTGMVVLLRNNDFTTTDFATARYCLSPGPYDCGGDNCGSMLTRRGRLASTGAAFVIVRRGSPAATPRQQAATLLPSLRNAR